MTHPPDRHQPIRPDPGLRRTDDVGRAPTTPRRASGRARDLVRPEAHRRAAARAEREPLTADLEGSRTLGAGLPRELLARLESEGLIRGDEEIELTADGEPLYRDLREYIAEPTARLLGRLDPDDVDTTVRTLQAITVWAAEGLSARPGSRAPR